MSYMKRGCLILKKDKQNEFIYFATDDTFDESKVDMSVLTQEQEKLLEKLSKQRAEDLANGKYNI